MLVAIVVVLGPGASFFGDDFGSPSRLEELGPEYAEGRADIEAVVREDGTGAFTARAIATCAAGTIVRIGEGQTATATWTEDEYRCDAGSFIVRTEWPIGTGDSSAEVQGRWTITSGADDYGDIVGGGTAAKATGPGQPDVLTGTIGFDF